MGPNTHIRRQCDPYMYMKHPEPITHSKFLAMAEFLIKAAKVPAMLHAIGTKPYLDIKYAQIFLDAGASIHRRDRYGESTTREAAKAFVTKMAATLPVKAGGRQAVPERRYSTCNIKQSSIDNSLVDARCKSAVY
ncbi:hypothetical protein K432DRAFT_395347 [Lepidopterella palustris CBS 459.81]|uniref:Uncharacterized protein n=1 Tax=Lepidopterella palustris CBS 459.81 TaxID=1314670 RepID=A0A8E2JCR6_9PEZI|nr:hypothetical protein K432DRAFT_395347 [Lepidopterella palustris CBS 459.81]